VFVISKIHIYVITVANIWVIVCMGQVCSRN